MRSHRAETNGQCDEHQLPSRPWSDAGDGGGAREQGRRISHENTTSAERDSTPVGGTARSMLRLLAAVPSPYDARKSSASSGNFGFLMNCGIPIPHMGWNCQN
jgi:hypothetical protein